MELDLKSERRIYEAGIRPSAEIGLDLIDRLEQAEQIITIRESELLELKGKCSNPECRLHRAHSGPCDCTALDGDGRG